MFHILMITAVFFSALIGSAIGSAITRRVEAKKYARKMDAISGNERT